MPYVLCNYMACVASYSWNQQLIGLVTSHSEIQTRLGTGQLKHIHCRQLNHLVWNSEARTNHGGNVAVFFVVFDIKQLHHQSNQLCSSWSVSRWLAQPQLLWCCCCTIHDRRLSPTHSSMSRLRTWKFFHCTNATLWLSVTSTFILKFLIITMLMDVLVSFECVQHIPMQPTHLNEGTLNLIITKTNRQLKK